MRTEARRLGSTLFRNNSGVLNDALGRPVRFGLGNESKKQNEHIKSSDLIGITPIIITQEMVGKTIGVFTSLEIKREDWTFSPKDKREVAQKNWIDFILMHGGFAGFANSVDRVIEILKR